MTEFGESTAVRRSWHQRTVTSGLSLSLFLLFGFQLLLLLQFFPLGLGLFLQLLLILEKDHLLHDDSLVRVLDVLEHLVLLRELGKSRGAHVKSDISTLKIVFVFLVKFGGLVHGLNHDRVGHIILFLVGRLQILFLRQDFGRIHSLLELLHWYPGNSWRLLQISFANLLKPQSRAALNPQLNISRRFNEENLV